MHGKDALDARDGSEFLQYLDRQLVLLADEVEALEPGARDLVRCELRRRTMIQMMPLRSEQQLGQEQLRSALQNQFEAPASLAGLLGAALGLRL